MKYAPYPNCAGFYVDVLCITVKYKPSQGSTALLLGSWNRSEDVSEYEGEPGRISTAHEQENFPPTQEKPGI